MLDSSPHYIDSYYAASSRDVQVQRPSLAQTLDADCVVVGAGYTGLYTALHLATAGQRVVVLDASRVAWGASGRNGGQVILGFSCDMEPFEAALGREAAREMWGMVEAGAADISRLIRTHAIDCDYAPGHLWTAVLPRRVSVLTEWQKTAAERWNYHDLTFIPRADLPAYVGSTRYQAGLLDRRGGHLHPLKYALGLARVAEQAGARIFENSRVERLQETESGVVVHTAHGRVRAGRVVLACNAYIDRLYPDCQRKILPVGCYMIATEPLSEALARSVLPRNVAVSDNQFILDYFRLSADRRLLFGGKCSYTGRTPSGLAQGMRADMLRVFPQLAAARIDHVWGGHIDITLSRAPDCGRAGPIYWAQGFSGHGLVPTWVAARALADAILGNDHALQRFMALKHRQFPANEKLAGMLQVAGMAYYRARDYF